ncbi:MAG: hypothetical protein ACI9PN_002682, partial [Candidatus Azotimanducaceae bacterium]
SDWKFALCTKASASLPHSPQITPSARLIGDSNDTCLNFFTQLLPSNAASKNPSSRPDLRAK